MTPTLPSASPRTVGGKCVSDFVRLTGRSLRQTMQEDTLGVHGAFAAAMAMTMSVMFSVAVAALLAMVVAMARLRGGLRQQGGA